MLNDWSEREDERVEGVPFIGISLYTEEHAKDHVFVSIGGTSFFSGAVDFYERKLSKINGFDNLTIA